MNIMTTTILTSRIRRRSINKSATHTPMVRQWQLLEWLSSEPEGVTVAEAAIATGMDQKTIRRDLILLRKIGFDLDETVEEFGRKR
jgi:predicted DNA-binding transcriptional regulator YafY